MNLELLQGTLTVTPEPGLDTLDPRWSELSGLVQEGHFAEAAQKSEALLQEGIYDVRVVGYLCFGHFLDGGPASLARICDAISSVLNGNWEAFGPAPSRAKLTQQSLGWLFKQTLKQLQHGESTQSDAWQAWQETPPEQVDEALTRLFELQQAIGPRLDKGAASVLEPLGKVEAWLRSFQTTLQAAAPAAGDEADDDAGDGAAATATATNAKATATAATATAGTATVAAPVDGGSYHLMQLLRKIEAFATLLERGKLASALVVAEDVNAILAEFDPLLYFPKLFSRFLRLTVVHAGDLAKAQVEREAPAWKALRALYQVDLEQFLALE